MSEQLNEAISQEPEVKEKEKPVEDENVTLTRRQLNHILKEIDDLKKGKTSIKPVAPKFRTARVRFVDDKLQCPIVRYGSNRRDKRPDGSEYLTVQVFYQEGEAVKDKWLPWVEFVSSGQYLDAVIIDEKKKEIVKEKGFTRMKNVDYDNYRTIDTGIDVPMEEVSYEYIYKMELPDGRILEIDSSALN
jgi:hypothetical protein